MEASAIESVIRNYKILLETLDQTADDKSLAMECSATVRNLIRQLKMSETYFRCAVAFRHFTNTDSFTTAIQKAAINMLGVVLKEKMF